MNNPQKQLLRHAILIQLEAASPASLPLETVLQGVTFAGHTVSEPHLSKQVQYLVDKQLITARPQPISPGVLRFSLSAPGRDYLEEQGLA